MQLNENYDVTLELKDVLTLFNSIIALHVDPSLRTVCS